MAILRHSNLATFLNTSLVDQCLFMFLPHIHRRGISVNTRNVVRPYLVRIHRS